MSLNHSHALTILYYEVLRHFRIVASLAEVRPVILVEEPALDFAEDDHVINHRFLLEQALLDERLRPCFGAVDKLICLRAERGGRKISSEKFPILPISHGMVDWIRLGTHWTASLRASSKGWQFGKAEPRRTCWA